MSDPLFNKEVAVEIGMTGYSLENILAGKEGFVMLPRGVRTSWGSRRWLKTKVIAFEDVRANRFIIVANEQGQIKESEPAELNYGLSAGGFQRVGENFPLPVMMSSRSIQWKTLTKTSANTSAIITPSSGKKIRVQYLIISSAHVAVADVGICLGANPSVDADFLQRFYVPADGGTIAFNLIDSNFESVIDGPIYVYCAAAYANGVRFILGYREI